MLTDQGFQTSINLPGWKKSNSCLPYNRLLKNKKLNFILGKNMALVQCHSLKLINVGAECMETRRCWRLLYVHEPIHKFLCLESGKDDKEVEVLHPWAIKNKTTSAVSLEQSKAQILLQDFKTKPFTSRIPFHQLACKVWGMCVDSCCGGRC